MDTLQIDTAAVSAWRANSDFDYEREIARSGKSLWERWDDAVNEFLSKLFGNSLDNIEDWKIWVIIGAIVLIAVIAFIIIYKPKIFFRNKKSNINYTATEDNIYGIDFDGEIANAVNKENWREAVRFTYLRLLRLLSDHNLIDWQIFKTPTQYTFEFANTDFRSITNLFLRVRYGGYEATRNDYALADSLSTKISQTISLGKTETEKGGGK